MATTLFDRPLFVQRKHYVEEIASLEDAVDLLETWPADQRGVPHEILMKACQRAANGQFPVAAVRLNLERFLRKAGALADIRDVPNFAPASPEMKKAG
ncbi:MAG: DUF982 domain-containing protein [Hyphomicrobiales bacterium]|nr:MAG: DUF982 domain-containing protein [Hyphomicrobiales bacterium]